MLPWVAHTLLDKYTNGNGAAEGGGRGNRGHQPLQMSIHNEVLPPETEEKNVDGHHHPVSRRSPAPRLHGQQSTGRHRRRRYGG